MDRVIDLTKSYPYYEFQPITNYALLGLRGARCTIQPYHNNGRFITTHYDKSSGRILFGDKISLRENVTIQLSDQQQEIIKSFHQYVLFCHYIPEDGQILIFEGFDLYRRVFKYLEDNPLSLPIIYKGSFDRSVLDRSCFIRFFDHSLPRYKFIIQEGSESE